MVAVRKTAQFDKWLRKLGDVKAKVKILRRIDQIELNGHFGDHKGVGDGVSELRFQVGPGYRVYYTRQGDEIVLLLCGGDKDSQDRDIAKAKEIAASL